eukprot:Clim_evm54s77 gene=Clim_evmTU54s77
MSLLRQVASRTLNHASRQHAVRNAFGRPMNLATFNRNPELPRGGINFDLPMVILVLGVGLYTGAETAAVVCSFLEETEVFVYEDDDD